MVSAIVAVILWVAFGVVVACWGGWLEREREGLGSGRWRE
jgi:hypothetical protein